MSALPVGIVCTSLGRLSVAPPSSHHVELALRLLTSRCAVDMIAIARRTDARQGLAIPAEEQVAQSLGLGTARRSTHHMPARPCCGRQPRYAERSAWRFGVGGGGLVCLGRLNQGTSEPFLCFPPMLTTRRTTQRPRDFHRMGTFRGRCLHEQRKTTNADYKWENATNCRLPSVKDQRYKETSAQRTT